MNITPTDIQLQPLRVREFPNRHHCHHHGHNSPTHVSGGGDNNHTSSKDHCRRITFFHCS